MRMIMKIKIIRLSLIFLLLNLSSNVWAQYNDAALWTSLEAETTFKKNLKFRGEIGYRLNDNYQKTDKYYVETGIQYKFNKFLRLSTEYRFIQKNIREDNFYATRHRFTSEIKSGYKFAGMRFNWTGKYQFKIFDEAEHNWGNTKTISHIRNKFQLKYKIKGKTLYPYVYYEFFIPLNVMNLYQYSLESHRIAGGLEYQFNKKNSIKLYFLYEKELHEIEDINSFISGIGYSFSF